MDELAERFEENRAHLTRVAYRMLGSASEAEDAVQETWLRVARSDTEAIDNLAGWLTTVVARICLDALRSRRHEELVPEPIVHIDDGPEDEAILADSVGVALLVVLETLTPAERLAFVLHDMFAVPFSEIAEILERTPDAVRQLASRGRRRVRGAAPRADASLGRQRELVAAFLAASRAGDFEALVAVLDPDVVFRVRGGDIRPATVHGADEVARTVLARGRPLAPLARPAIVNGVAGAIVGPLDDPISVVAFTIVGDRIASVDVIARPKLAR
ncbi:MAG TPA: sigma-70 family RNA polymerase sigma factor [Gaiellaceae bacterium]|nr:sigma-70 family RNA polymerase sigma factor [Gaiellaceae bacterium]